MINRHFVLLNDVDNVFVCCKQLLTGESTGLEGSDAVMTADITVGHKIARRKVAKGEKIIKYGVSIGSATKDIVFGEHIHMHNMKSDYIASHTRQKRSGE
ncbi:UxaA family hydrolase [Pseudocolwellia sp. AS88]|uniref:UxaA family hydrolase n=1 Tax=Pseudocolwellia sp. AS88 TaxID=3063958 RepID=UPI0026EED550|nr:UxaA family hydrolase [Pseudocolwellia sp. AS88]MDO7085518.1 UxaA family hydrolase [Pseudocolwellia sp. AS88]